MKKYIAHESRGGIFCRSIPVYVDKRLKNMPYAQAGWCYEESGTRRIMYSYSSRIFIACVSAWGIEYISTQDADATVNCSRTTSRQVSAAMRELGLSDSEIVRLKRFFARGGERAAQQPRGQWVNADTGEVIA